MSDVPCTPLQFPLDHNSASDLMLLAVCSDIASVKRLVTDTYSWLGEVFLNSPDPTDAQLESLLGPNFAAITIEFVYPIRAEVGTEEEVIVQLLSGTNVLTVRTMAPGSAGGEGGEEGALAVPISITLYSPTPQSLQGLAYCHLDFGTTDINVILQTVAEIVVDPLTHLQEMNQDSNRTIQRVYNAAPAEVLAPTTPLQFVLVPGSDSVANLRFLFQCHRLPVVDPSEPEPVPLPCLKPSGPFTVDPDTGMVTVEVDTIAFIDYAPVPNPPPPADPEQTVPVEPILTPAPTPMPLPSLPGQEDAGD